MFIVYRHINRNNGKSYIGITPKDPTSILPEGINCDEHSAQLMNVRWVGHCSTARSCSSLVFHKAIRKHGEDAFDHNVLEVCQTLNDVLEREKYWIKELRTTIDE